MVRVQGETVCPYCGKNADMEYVEESARLVGGPDYPGEAAFQCFACKRLLIGGRRRLGLMEVGTVDPREEQFYSIHEHSTPSDIAHALIGFVEYWEPTKAVGRSTPNVPAHIASAIDEAYRCHSIGAYRAAVLMARGVIEAGAKHFQVTQGMLEKKIIELGDKELLRPVLVESAHEIRHIGNDAAHGDYAKPDPDNSDLVVATVTEEDATDVLEFMDEIVDELFALPTRVQRRQERRNAAKVAPADQGGRGGTAD